MSTNPLLWFKSSYSNDSGGACVEVALDGRQWSGGGAGCGHTVHVRDSKNPGPTLRLAGEAWAGFTGWAARP
ncbi:DUF397 domain-containing protein [Streptomyces subrutilus]|uniref:DUF397 domain-containing protein n=1 Tax=Streptomyces subrutilus TaxID=36818 RepID=A0A5P2UMG3_9ACTN|nr:DUF397 domain-containing protein [Streptomyces subrutilus]QEU79589.1 DUF397 domain-containing protein [Streptomyces subrutilus]WSJ31178.1 DUF397 domain-containing protein [Streptomyces subrutilus]GGZ84946.1 toxin [Streptomyces subrutilus]